MNYRMGQFWKISLLTFFILSLFTHSLFAQPNITSISGKFSHNNIITIKGNNFGTKNQASPVVWDNLEDGICNTSATIGSWAGVNSLTIGNSNNRHSHSNYNAHKNMSGETNAYFTGGNDSPKWFVQYWFKLGNNFAFSDDIRASLGNIKFFRMWSTASVPENFVASFHSRYDVLATNEYVEQEKEWSPVVSNYKWIDMVMGHGDPGYVSPGYLGWRHYANDISKDTWHCFQFEFQDSSIHQSDGIWRVWFNGKLIIDKANLRTRNLSYTSYKRPYIVGFYDSHTTGNDGNNDFYIDDTYIDNTWARIEIGNNVTHSSCLHREIQIPSAWSNNSITFTVNQGSFHDGDTAYLFLVDANRNVSKGHQIIIGSDSNTPVDKPPNINISNPSSGDTYTTSEGIITIGGNSSDDNKITNITWKNNRGEEGQAINLTGDWAIFDIYNLNLADGENIFTITASDVNQTSTATITITYLANSTAQAWSATEQTKDSNWKDSVVTYCVRLLIEGNQITESSEQKIMLGFQGRSHGEYTISKVSIAEKDENGAEGDVIDSTWTKVTFDANSEQTWLTNIATVRADTEKLSDPISFKLQSGVNYYITFNILTPSTYLTPPDSYKELYFLNQDHTEDIDWSGKGYSTTCDYHAFSRIYMPSPPASPILKIIQTPNT